MKKQPKYSPEALERAVRMVREASSEYELQWAAIVSSRPRSAAHLIRCAAGQARTSVIPASVEADYC